MHFELVVISGPDEGDTFPLPENQPLYVGRKNGDKQMLRDPKVSRHHCTVSLENGDLVVSDNQSRNGTYVNGKKVVAMGLRLGDTVEVGDSKLLVHATGATLPPLKKKRANTPAGPLSELVNRHLAHYWVESAVAKGSSGVIFRALDIKQERTVALKVFWPEMCDDTQTLQRIVRSAQIMKPLQHPNIVGTFGAGKTGPYCWVAMEYVDGGDLREVLRQIGVEGKLHSNYALRVAFEIAQALDFASKNHIVHRNVNPRHIFTCGKYFKLGDLLMAKALQGRNAAQVTQVGQPMGDAPYMAPEQFKGSQYVDIRSDIYGLGATVYALVAGQPPFQGNSSFEVLNKVQNEKPMALSDFQIGLNPYVSDMIMKMMAKDPQSRYQTPGEVLEALDRVAKMAHINL